MISDKKTTDSQVEYYPLNDLQKDNLVAVLRNEFGNFQIHVVTEIVKPGHYMASPTSRCGSFDSQEAATELAERNGYEVVNKGEEIRDVMPVARKNVTVFTPSIKQKQIHQEN